MATSCYMAMGRVVLHATPQEFRNKRTLWVPPRFMTPIFVTCYIIAFLVQVIGGVSSTSDDLTKKKRGYNIIKIGLVLQLICFRFFLLISFRFHSVAKRFRQSWPDTRWTRFLWVINIACTLIFVRSVYRLIEFCTGFDGYLATHGWNFYVFEAALILPVICVFNLLHPSQYLSNTRSKQSQTGKESFTRSTGDDFEMTGRDDNSRFLVGP